MTVSTLTAKVARREGGSYGRTIVLGFAIFRQLIHFKLDRNPHGPGWKFEFRLGPGAGSRWIDFPGYSMNVAAPWYRKLTIVGRTLVVGRNMRTSNVNGRTKIPFYVTGLSKKCNRGVYPGWWT